MDNAHAEIGVIQQAWKDGKTQGQDMTIKVSGKEVCDFCRSDLRDAAAQAGLKSLTVVDEKAGVTYFWTIGMKKFEVRKGP